MKIEDRLIEDIWRLLGFVAVASFLLFDPLGFVVANALAQETGATAPPESATYRSIVDTLVKIFILAVLIEVALSVLFRWRIYLRYFEGRGWKVPIAFFVSLAIVVTYDINVPADVVGAFGGTTGDGKEVGYFVSALIIAGGSSSVNSVFERLGWRNPLAQQQQAEQMRQQAPGRLRILVTRPAGSSSEGRALTVSLDGVAVGTIKPHEDRFGGLLGHKVAPGSHTIDVAWTDQAGAEQKAIRSVVVATGAAVAETFTLS